MSGPVFVLAFGIAALALVSVVRAIAAAIGGRSDNAQLLAEVREQLLQHSAALEDDEVRLAGQAAQLAELQERLDFAERLLTEQRDQLRLGSRKEPDSTTSG